MNNTQNYKTKIDELRLCVVIPTYNNSATLADVIDGVLEYTKNIIIVNDGSNDNTESILSDFKDIEVISYKKNKGKGHALKLAFVHALKLGYKYALTIDSDGQHLPDDIPLFIDKLVEHPDSLIIGARDMDKEGVPRKSNFGRKFSNFWYKVETGIHHNDTQSGFRLYPIDLLGDIKFISGKFEFEVEAIVRAAWSDIKIESVPVHVNYESKEKRISHFRTVRDFARISLLNTCLVTWALLYIKPFNLIRHIRRRTVKEFIKDQVMASGDSNMKIASSVTLGIFMGIVPLWGYQLALAIALAYLFKLKKSIVIVTANISIPPMIPFVLYFSYRTGALVLGKNTPIPGLASGVTFELIKNNLLQYIVGATCLAALLSLALGIVTFVLLEIFRKKKN